MDSTFEPGYLKLLRSGELQSRVAQAYARLSKCDVCAWGCGVDRRVEAAGKRCTGVLARLSSYVLPNGLAGTAEIVHFLAEQISPDTYLNLMDQYRPAFNARQYPELSRPIIRQEYQEAIQMAHTAGLYRLD